MSWLALNGIDIGAIAAVFPNAGKESRREIGEQDGAVDGTMVRTLQIRKRDVGFDSIMLLRSDAFAWESLVEGEGEHWSFDTSLYGSKGTGPAAGFAASQTAGTPKFGAGVLRVNATTGTITFGAAATGTGGLFNSKWTVMVWRYETAVWHHYIVTSAGHKWLDGVRADGTSTTWLTVGGTGDVTIANTAGAAQDYDDLVVLPYEILDSWGPTWGAQTTAFSNLPNLTASGQLVDEAATRTMMGVVTAIVITPGQPSGSSLQTDMKILSIELTAV